MSLIREQAAFLRDVRRLLAFAEEQGFLATAGELERSPEAQAQHLREGRAATMDSMHLRKCAIDLYFFVEEEGRTAWVHSLERLEAIGAHWESLDPRNRWGGRHQGALDLAHFERDLGAWPSSSTSALEPPALERETAAVSTPERPGAIAQAPPSGQRPTLRRGSDRRQEILVLQEQLVGLKLLDRTSGEFDGATERAVVEFQQQHRLVADGIVGPKTWGVLEAVRSGSAAPSRWLGDADLERAAEGLGVERAALRAVYQVESNGRGFAEDQPKILFEGHVFWRQLKAHGLDPQPLAGGNADLVYPRWTRQYYGDQAHERDRLRRAEAIHETAARESASWGLFQIMGFHWRSLDYASINDFVDHMARHERDQLEAFCRFLRATGGLVEALRQRDWPAFAHRYNGPGYRANAYDDKLRAAYLRFKAAASA
jgi:peptidoglycan hydrolase-like protein with peptidoglycan-binding domain